MTGWKIIGHLALALLGSALPAEAQDQLTKPALGSPEITAIRKLYQAVEHDDAKGRLTRAERDLPCEPFAEKLTRFTDARGITRKFIREGGGEDSAAVVRSYYDERQRLRFVFITAGAVNGSRLEHRLYLSEDGNRLREDHKYTHGPGYTFPEVWPESDIAADPRRAFAAEQCE